MAAKYTIPEDKQLFLTTIKASEATLAKTSRVMYSNRVRSCLVIDDDNVLVGLVTARKIIKAMSFNEDASVNLSKPHERGDNQRDSATPYMIPPSKLLVTPQTLTDAQKSQLQRKMQHLNIVYVPVVNLANEITDVLTFVDIVKLRNSGSHEEINQILTESLADLVA